MSDRGGTIRVRNNDQTLQICSCGVLYENAKICLSIRNLLGIRCERGAHDERVNFLLTLNPLQRRGNRGIVSQMMAL